MKQSNLMFSYFYCPVCGKQAMELPRKKSLKKKTFHRKKLYCPWCKDTHNCIECHDDYDIFRFKEDFEKGLYKEEVNNG